MGSNWTQICAQNGYQVVVSDITDEILRRGLSRIESRLKETGPGDKLQNGEKSAVLERITGTTDTRDFCNCDLVIETVVEKMEVKRTIFSDLDKVCPPEVILATNTSVLSILDMAVMTARPDKVIGIHADPLLFPAVEVIRTIMAVNDAIDVGKKFVQSLGKQPIICNDTPGFLGNRVLIPLFFNVVRMLENGIASKEEIEMATKMFLFLPMGALSLMDHAGLDTFLLAGDALYDELREPQYAPPLLLKKMVTAGWLGKKTGKGFFEYRQ
jgi:3-hydroxybutyryl-CoA dehydrogenase